MDSSEHSARTLFAEALEIENPRQRAEYLSQACGENAALKREVEELLNADAAAARSFLPKESMTPQQPLARAVEGLLESGRTALRGCLSEQPGDTIGRYKLIEQIGEGGCGVVYMAEQEEPVRRRVALKVIKLGMDTRNVVTRFEAERQALALMDHPNIAKVFDGGATATGRPYFVMELVRGVKITEYCDQHRLSPQARLELFILVCQAVQHAHQKGIIHRDLKPSNILVTVNDGVGVPKVIDFGIAKATEGRLTDRTLFTSFELFLGTPAYMSPEQAVVTSVDIDTRSDIYSLGVLLYELLTGKTPFETQALLSAGLDELRRTIREKEPAPPSTRLRGLVHQELATTASQRQSEGPKLIHTVRGDLDWIVMKCLRKDRAGRYATANGLASDIQRHLNYEPVLARPPSRLYEFQKTVRRHKAGFLTGAAIVLGLSAAAWVSTWEAIRARGAEREQGRLRTAAEGAERRTRLEAYARTMLLAYQAHQASDYGLVRDLLNETRTFSALGDGNKTAPLNPAWEWRNLAYEARDESTEVFPPCEDRVRALAASADGRWLAAGLANGQALLWRLPERRLQAQWQIGNEVACLLFSPDSRCLAVGCDNGMTRLLGIPDGDTRAEFQELNRIQDLRFSRDGLHLAFCSNQQVRIASTLTGQADPPMRQMDGWRAAISPDLESVVRSVLPDLLVLYKGATNLVLNDVPGNRNSRNAQKFSPDGHWLASTLSDHSVQIWAADGFQPARKLVAHTRTVDGMAWSEDSRLLATGGGDQVICIWDVARGRLLRRLRGHQRGIVALAFSPDGRVLYSGGGDKAIRTWTSLEADPQPEVIPLLPGLSLPFLAPGAQFLCTASAAGFRFFELAPKLHIYDFQGSGSVYALSSDGRWLAVPQSQGEQGGLWRREPNGFFRRASHPEFGDARMMAFSRDGGRLGLFSGSGGGFGAWDVEPWHARARWPSKEALITRLTFDPPGKRLFAIFPNEGLLAGDLESGRLIRFSAQKTSSDGGLVNLDISLDNQRLATANQVGPVVIWSVAPDEDPRPLMTLPPIRGGVWSVAFSPDRRRLAVGTFHGEIQLWDLQHQILVGSLRAHRQAVCDLAFQPEDGTLVSLSIDEVHLWRVTNQDGKTQL